MIRMRLAVLPWLLLLSGSALPALANSGPGMRLASGAADVARIAPPRIDQALSTLVDSGELVGVSALVWQDGREAYFGSFGLADREAGRPMARDTIVQIYSMTKPLTGVALMQLYEQGRLDLDAPLAQYLPEYAAVRVYAGTDVKGKPLLVAPDRPILVRDILRHTAGFASGGNEPGPVGAMYRKADPENFGHTLEQMSRRLAGVPLLYQPGTRWLYSSAVDVQARLVEVLSGKPFARYLQDHVLGPLGMDDTGYTLGEGDWPRVAALYQRSDDGVMTRIPDAKAYPLNRGGVALTPGSWGLTSTLDDYMRFARMLANGGQLDGVRLLQPATVRLMASDSLPAGITDTSWLPGKGRVGFGIDFAVRIAPPARADEASGEVGEFFWDGAANTLFWVDPVNDITAVLFAQWVPFGKVPLHKVFRDAVYADDTSAAAPRE